MQKKQYLLLRQCATGKMLISLKIQQNVKNKQTTKLCSFFNKLQEFLVNEQHRSSKMMISCQKQLP